MRSQSGTALAHYTYDYVGNRSTMMVTSGGVSKTHVYSYDAAYQLTHVDYPPELSYLATDTTFDYDAAGNRTSVIDGSGTTPYSTNSLNQYTSADGTSFQYDASGNMTADGAYTYSYDAENRLVQVYKPGPFGTLTLGEALDSPLPFTTGGDGEWATTSWGEGHGDNNSAYSPALAEGQSSWLETQVTGPGTFRFWAKMSPYYSSEALEFYVDGILRYNCETDAWEDFSWTFNDTNSHTLRWVFTRGSGSAGTGYVDDVQWDGAIPPQPVPERDPDNRRWLEYTYDAAGHRVEKKYDYETVATYVYDGDHCLAEYDPFGTLRRKYIYGPGVDQPVCMIEAAGTYAGTYYYHFDALGNVVGLTNASGNTVEVYDYDVYGRVGATDASHPNRFMFTGREFDKETGLYYYRARYYKPEIGRFLQVDPVGYEAGMNLYRYCSNNPWNLTDPYGDSPYDVNKDYRPDCEREEIALRRAAQALADACDVVTRLQNQVNDQLLTVLGMAVQIVAAQATIVAMEAAAIIVCMVPGNLIPCICAVAAVVAAHVALAGLIIQAEAASSQLESLRQQLADAQAVRDDAQRNYDTALAAYKRCMMV